MKVLKFLKKIFPFLSSICLYSEKRNESYNKNILVFHILSKNFGHLKLSDEFSHAFIHFENFFFLV